MGNAQTPEEIQEIKKSARASASKVLDKLKDEFPNSYKIVINSREFERDPGCPGCFDCTFQEEYHKHLKELANA